MMRRIATEFAADINGPLTYPVQTIEHEVPRQCLFLRTTATHPGTMSNIRL